MTLVKLKTEQKFKAGQTNIIPMVGKVSFNEDCVIEVDNTKVNIEDLIQLMPEFSLFGEEEDIKPKTQENDLGKGGEDDKLLPKVEEPEILGSAIETNQQEQKVNVDEVKAALEEKSADEIKKLISDFPEEQTKDLKNKKERIEFLVQELTK